MIWLSWRQLRAQVVAVCLVVLAVALLLVATGPRLARLASSTSTVYDLLTSRDLGQFYGGLAVVAVAPALLGAFWGAPLVARELETGTYRLVWNQSVTRTRWLSVKLGSAVLATAVAVGALSAAVTWWSAPLDGTTSATHGALPARLTPVAFAMRGLVPVSYAVFALVLGTALGLLLRRTVPAMALTLLLYVLVQVAVPVWVRPHLLAPEDTTITVATSTLDGVSSAPGDAVPTLTVHTAGHGDWVLTNETVDASGRPSTLPSWFAACTPPPPTGTQGTQTAAVAGSGLDDCLARLDEEGYRQHVVYHPASRFWPLQWAESGCYLAVAGLLAGGSFWWMRHRLT
jgi:ABC-type transport system involved in multi-copper enzyme maturation permease subunit